MMLICDLENHHYPFLIQFCCAGLHPIRYFEAFPDVEPFGRREGYGNKAEWIVDLTTKADREGKHAHYADRYGASELRRVNLKELDLQLDRGYRVRPWFCAALCPCLSGQQESPAAAVAAGPEDSPLHPHGGTV